MPVAEASREAELKSQIADLKKQVSALDAGNVNLSKALKAAQVKAAEGDSAKEEVDYLKNELAVANGKLKNLEDALADVSKQAAKDAALVEAAKAVAAGLKALA